MSTVPAVTPLQAAQNLLNAAYDELCKKIKTGKLRSTQRNGALVIGRARELNPALFSDWQVKGFPTAKQLGEALYAAVTDFEFASTLDWEVLPKQLAKRVESRPVDAQDTRAASSFEERVRAGEKAAADAKVQAAARKQALDLVEGFSPLNHRSGRPTYEVPVVDERGRLFRDATTGAIKRQSVDKLRAEWRKRIAESKDAVKTLEAIKAERIHIYNALEKEAERI